MTVEDSVEKRNSAEVASLDATSAKINPFLVLKDNQYGKGVYAKVPLKEGTLLRLYKPENIVFNMKISDIPESQRKYVAYVDAEHCNAPADFNAMDIAWFVNHSELPNVVPVRDEVYKVQRDIGADEEIFFDYNHLNEPTAQKEEFYKK